MTPDEQTIDKLQVYMRKVTAERDRLKTALELAYSCQCAAALVGPYGCPMKEMIGKALRPESSGGEKEEG